MNREVLNTFFWRPTLCFRRIPGSQPGESFAIQRLGDHERGAAWHLANVLAKWAVATLGSDSNHFPRPHGPRGGNANLTKGTWFEMDFMKADASLATWA